MAEAFGYSLLIACTTYSRGKPYIIAATIAFLSIVDNVDKAGEYGLELVQSPLLSATLAPC